MRRRDTIAAATMGTILAVYSYTYESPKMLKSHGAPISIKQTQYQEYFRKAGSPSPQEMALAMVHPKVKYPKLLAAVAVVESNASPKIKNGGYKRRHFGAYQVNPRHHGRVPADALGQTLQAQAILEELQVEHGKGFISAYGGDVSKTGKYRRLILAELARTPE